jgi:transposase
MQPVSNDKRADIVAAKQRGESVVTIKKWFNISDSSISRIWNKFKKTGSYTPIPYTGRKSDITPETDIKIRVKIKETPDITLDELINELSLNLTVSGLSKRLAP